jgi:hypothetical protein
MAPPPAATFTGALASGDLSKVGAVWDAHLLNAGKVVSDFIANALIFVFSRMLSDGIAIYGFGLNSPWFCSYGGQTCTASAEPLTWLIYALAWIPVGGLFKHLAEDASESPSAPRWFKQVPDVMNYVVGWACGNCAASYLSILQGEVGCNDEIFDVSTNTSYVEGCASLNAEVSLMATMAGTIFLMLLKPLVQQIEFGNNAKDENGNLVYKDASGSIKYTKYLKDTDGNVKGELKDSAGNIATKTCGDTAIDWCEDFLEDVLAMVSRGLTVCIMVLWVTTYYSWEYQGIASDASDKVSLLFCLTAIFLGSSVSASLEELEKAMKSGVADPNDPPITIKVALEFSNMIQNILSFVAGCSAIDFIAYTLTTLGAEPSWYALGCNLVIVFLIAVICIVWLVLTGESGSVEDDEATDRDEVEKFFITNAMAFCTGWFTFVVGRMMIVPLGIFAESYLETSGFVSGHSNVGERIVVLITVPIFTYVCLISGYSLIDHFQARIDAAKARGKGKYTELH